jgi:hypothetical protein
VIRLTAAKAPVSQSRMPIRGAASWASLGISASGDMKLY